MPQVVQAACPGCKSVLQIPADWVSQAIRCKACGTVMQAKAPAPAPVARWVPSPAPVPAAPTPPPVAVPPPAPRSAKTPVPAARKSAPPPPPVVKPAPVKPATAPLPVGRAVAPAPAPAAVPSFDFMAPAEDTGSVPSRRRKKRGGGSWIGLGILAGILLLGGVVTYAFLPKIKAILAEAAAAEKRTTDDEDPPVRQVHKPKPSGKVSNPAPKGKPRTGQPSEKPNPTRPIDKPKDPTKPKPKPRPNPPPDEDPPTTPRPTPLASGQFPRRALIISVHNYLYANPLSDPPQIKESSIDRLTRALGNGLKVPTTQIFRLSDMDKKEPRPPLKTVIEQGLTNFLKTTRKQDRILVFFLGHTKAIDNEAFLVPIEGEFEDAKTLIPLKWVYEQMAKCDCRQKILIIDGNRFDAAQGEERPSSGPMDPKFEAALKSPPPGVQVWSACSSGQQSNEFEEAPLGLFLDTLRRGLAPEKGKGATTGRIQQADDLIPLAVLNEWVGKNMADALEKRKLVQKPFISGNPPLVEVAYDKTEAPAARPMFPSVASGDQKLVKQILDEISLPSLKGNEGGGQDVKFNHLPPFSPDALKAYDGELKPDSKLRQAIHDARVALWAISRSTPPADLQGDVENMRARLKVNLSIMQDKYTKPGAGRAEMIFKDRVFEDSKQMSRIVAELEDVLQKLKEAGEEKDKAPKRWQANYTIILARFQAQLAYLEEYQSLLGAMRKEFPPHDPAIHNGWKMAAKEKASDAAGKKYDKSARKLYGDAASAYRGTPWEVLAKREKFTALGLEWQPY
jgi:hypothetical protein